MNIKQTLSNTVSDIKDHPLKFFAGGAISLGAVFMCAALGKEAIESVLNFNEAKATAELLGQHFDESKEIARIAVMCVGVVAFGGIAEAGRQLAKYGTVPILNGFKKNQADTQRAKRLQR